MTVASKRRLSVAHVAGNLVPMLSGIATAPLTARAVGVDDRGSLAVITLVSSLAMVAGSLGMGWYAREMIAAGSMSLRDLLHRTIPSDLAFAVLAMAMTRGLVLRLDLDGKTAICVGMYLAIATSSASRSAVGAVVVANGWLHAYGLGSLVQTAFSVCMIVMLFLIGHLSVATSVLVLAVGIAIQAAWNLGVVLRHSSGRRSLAQRTSGRPSMRRASSVLLTQLTDVATARSDLILVTLVGTASEIGLYSVVAMLPQVAYQVSNTLVQQAFASFGGRSREERFAATWTAAVAFTSALVMVAVPAAWIALPVVFGAEFSGGRAFLLPAGAFSIGCGLLVPLIQHAALSGGAARIQLVTAAAFAVGLGCCTLGLAVSASLAIYGILMTAIAVGAAKKALGSGARPRASTVRQLLNI